MLKKSILLLLSLYLIFILGQSFLKLFDWDLEIINSEKVWVKILSVEKHTRKSHVKGIDLGAVTTWNATIQVNNQQAIVYISSGRAPKQGECILINANETSKGTIIATLDVEEWRHGTSYSSCQ